DAVAELEQARSDVVAGGTFARELRPHEGATALELTGRIRSRLERGRAAVRRIRQRFEQARYLGRVGGGLGRPTEPQRGALKTHDPRGKNFTRALAQQRGELWPFTHPCSVAVRSGGCHV